MLWTMLTIISLYRFCSLIRGIQVKEWVRLSTCLISTTYNRGITSKTQKQKTKPSLITQQSSKCIKTNLDEANFLGVAAEALPAAHEPILSDQPMWVSANPTDSSKINA